MPRILTASDSGSPNNSRTLTPWAARSATMPKKSSRLSCRKAGGEGPEVDVLVGVGGEVEPALGGDGVAVGVERDELLLRRSLDLVGGGRRRPSVALAEVERGGYGGSGALGARSLVIHRSTVLTSTSTRSARLRGLIPALVRAERSRSLGMGPRDTGWDV